MRDIKELKDFIWEKIKDETTLNPDDLTWDAQFTEFLDSLGIQLILMDIEEEFCEPGFMIEEEFIVFFFERNPTVQETVDIFTDYLLENIDAEEAIAMGDEWKYEKMHEW